MRFDELVQNTDCNQTIDINLFKSGLFDTFIERKKELNLFESALQCFGTEAQLRQLQEECAEAIAAINRNLRFPKLEYFTNLVEEIVDVQIVLDQIKLTIPPDSYRNMYDMKFAKLKNLLSEKGYPKPHNGRKHDCG